MGSSKGTEDEDEREPLLGGKKISEPHTGPFSKPAIFIYITVFGSNYSYYAIQTILPLFLRNSLLYSENTSTIIYQIFDGLSNILPLYFAIFADSILGKYRANVHFSVIYVIGNIILTVAAMALVSITDGKVMANLALIVVAIGYGGIVPVLAAFGGDQFVLPQQQAEVTTFFATYYFMINCGSTLANIFTPMLRKDVHCLGQHTCYSLGFGVPAFTATVGLVVFIFGKNFYKIKEITENVIAKTFKCVAYAIGNKNADNNGKPEHWLDKASEKYGQPFVDDVKMLFRLIVVFAPLIFFWALWNQQSSTWTFQATRMTGYITQGISIQPDQLQVTNSLLLLFLIPIFEMVVYPLLWKMGLLTKPLHRIALGCICIALSFVAAGILELDLQKSYPVIPNYDETSLNVINSLACPVTVEINPIFVENSQPTNYSLQSYSRTIPPLQIIVFQNIVPVDYNITAIISDSCDDGNSSLNVSSIEFLSQPGRVHTFLITIPNAANRTLQIISSYTNEDLSKSNEGNAILRVMGGNIPQNLESMGVTLASESETRKFLLNANDPEIISTEIDPNIFFVTLSFPGTNKSDEFLTSVDLEGGGSYLLGIFQLDNETLVLRNYVLTTPNSIHMLWQLPQYFALTIGELLVAITGYQFAYEQAPKSMKSLLQSIWMLPMGMGDVVIVLVMAIDVFSSQAITFFFFAGIMLLATVWFIIVAHGFKVQIPTPSEDPSISPPHSPFRKRRKSVVESMAAHIK